MPQWPNNKGDSVMRSWTPHGGERKKASGISPGFYIIMGHNGRVLCWFLSCLVVSQAQLSCGGSDGAYRHPRWLLIVLCTDRRARTCNLLFGWDHRFSAFRHHVHHPPTYPSKRNLGRFFFYSPHTQKGNQEEAASACVRACRVRGELV